MKVLVIGSGAREHALVWALKKCRKVDRIYCCPGNAGISELAECIDTKQDDIDSIVDLVKYEWIDMTVVGPEQPLVSGIADRFERENLKIVGPTSRGALIEGSKVFAKDFMKRYGIPTADYKTFSSHIMAEDYVKMKGAPIVVKADGLAAGKGVIIAQTTSEAIDAIKMIMKEKVFGKAGDRIILEEVLTGEEASYMVFTDGTHVVPIASAQDHKRALDGDKGPNTGGMGAYSPAPVISDSVESAIMARVINPMMTAFKREGITYKGVLYAGLMIKEGNPYVLEFNCRLGDPETQAVLMRLDSDILDIFTGIVEGSLDKVDIKWKPRPAVTIVAASKGYPGAYETGKVISGLEKLVDLDNVYAFHGGSAFAGDKVVTNGGRVLCVSALGSTIRKAAETAYDATGNISFDGMFYRKDIGYRAIYAEDAEYLL